MSDKYSLKVNVRRATLVLLAITCLILYKSNLANYILLVSIVIAFGGLFSISSVELTSKEVKIKKSYFWALWSIERTLMYDQIVSIRTKKYEIETYENIGMFTENILSCLTLEFLKPTVNWITTKLSYVEKGKSKNIELRMSKDDFKKIEKGTVNKDTFRSLRRTGKHSAQ